MGREEELQAIATFLEQRPASRALFIEGEAGIGKTTVWQMGVQAAHERGQRVLQARPTEAERELSFSALGDLLAPVAERLADLSPPRGRALEVALSGGADGAATPDARAIGLATLDLLRLLAAERPLLLALDDAQWLDSPSRETLAYALRRLDREPVALLAAQRPGAAQFVEPSERLGVDPLSFGALNRLLRERSPKLRRSTVLRIHETSGGNPFFAFELARALEGRELRVGEPLSVPASLSELTASRFESLDADMRQVLLLVAASARPTRAVVSAAFGDGALQPLESAIAAGLIEEDGPRLRFAHPLLASVHYGSVAPDERAAAHRRLAAVVTDPEERGRHLGAAATEPDAEVAAALDEAAAAARARGAPSSAAELTEVAVRLTPADDPESLLRRMCDAADHHFAAGSTERAQSMLEHAYRDATLGRERARVALQLAALLDSTDLTGVRPLLDQALLDADGDVMLEARIHAQLTVHFDGLDYRESQRHAHIALELAERTGDRRLIAETLAWAFDRDFWVGAGVDHELIGRGLALEDELPQLGLISRPSCAYAWALEWSGQLDEAGERWKRLRALGRAEGDLDVIHILFFSAYHELLAEDWERAGRFADEAWSLAVEAERDVEVSQCRRARATVDAYCGQVEGTRSRIEEAHRLGAAVGFAERRFTGVALGILDLSLGKPEPALAELRRVTEKKISQGQMEPGLMLGFPEHVEAAVACGELEEASEVLNFVEEHARRLDRAWGLACCARGRALHAAARGDDAAADSAFALAYVHHARRPQQLPTYELARTLLAHGSILRGRREQRQAREALTQAQAIFERLGARIYAERARSELGRIGGRQPSKGGLTATERRLAELVSEGRSNKEVAAALFVTPKTVETKLSRIYTKLGIHSRGELARTLDDAAERVGDSNGRSASDGDATASEIVGRDEELAALSSFLEQGAGAGALLIHGDPGIGKTTLWRWGVNHAAAQGWRPLTAAPAEAEARLAFAAIGDLLGGALGAVISRLPAPQRRALEVALLLEDAEGPPPDERTVAVAVLGALRALARDGPVLVAIDDVQWLDAPSADVLAFAFRRLGDDQVKALVAQRTGEEHSVASGLDRAFGERLRRLAPQPLSLGATHRVLRSRLDLTLPRPSMRRLHELSGGNPLYALELARALQEGSMELSQGGSLPSTLQELVGRRIAELPDKTQVALAEAAALSGATFIASDEAVVAPAIDAQVLRRVGRRVEFTHPLFRTAAYSRLSAAQRHALHRRLAEGAVDLEERARHLALATEWPDETVARLVEEGAAAAFRRGAPIAAAELAEQARRLTPADAHDDATRRALDEAEFRFEAGDVARAGALLEDAIERTAAGARRARLLGRLARVRHFADDVGGGVELLREALAEAGEDPALRAEIEEGLAWGLLSMRSDLRGAAAHARSAVRFARQLSDPAPLAEALASRAVTELALGRDPTHAMQRALELEESTLHLRVLRHPSFAYGYLLNCEDRLEEAREIFLELRRRATDHGDESALATILNHLTLVEFLAGNWEKADSYAEAGYSLALQSGQGPTQASILGKRALLEALRGAVDDARATARRSLEIAVPQFDPSSPQAALPSAGQTAIGALGLIELSLGRPEDAHGYLGPLTGSLLSSGIAEPGELRCLPDEVEALASLGRLAEAEAMLAPFEATARRLDRPTALAVAGRCRALVLAGRGDLSEAASVLEAALEQHDRRPIPFERGRTLLALGQVQRRAKRRRDARVSIERALSCFDELGASLWSERAGDELARIGGRAPSGGLTASESRLAALVVEGYSNKEAAAALFVTPKTVETKLSRIYAKLDIHSRAELARRLAESKL